MVQFAYPGKEEQKRLTGWFGTRTAERAPSQIFDGGHATARGKQNRMLAGSQARDPSLPSLVEQVEGLDAKGDGAEAQNEERKGRKELMNGIKLKSGKGNQKQPHPFPTAIFLAHS